MATGNENKYDAVSVSSLHAVNQTSLCGCTLNFNMQTHDGQQYISIFKNSVPHRCQSVNPVLSLLYSPEAIWEKAHFQMRKYYFSPF